MYVCDECGAKHRVCVNNILQIIDGCFLSLFICTLHKVTRTTTTTTTTFIPRTSARERLTCKIKGHVPNMSTSYTAVSREKHQRTQQYRKA